MADSMALQDILLQSTRLSPTNYNVNEILQVLSDDASGVLPDIANAALRWLHAGYQPW